MIDLSKEMRHNAGLLQRSWTEWLVSVNHHVNVGPFQTALCLIVIMILGYGPTSEPFGHSSSWRPREILLSVAILHAIATFLFMVSWFVVSAPVDLDDKHEFSGLQESVLTLALNLHPNPNSCP